MDIAENLYLNFHAHLQIPAKDEITIQSKFLQENLIMEKHDKIFFTAGLHPWHADVLTPQQVKEKLDKIIKAQTIIAVGETGIDKLKGPGVNKQVEIFKAHIFMAEKYKLPLIIHSVKAHNEILELKAQTKSKIPWVIHHFNASRKMAFDFLKHGFYFSICHHINNPKTKIYSYFQDLPIAKIFFETDDFDVNIKDIYKTAAQKLNIDEETLKKQIIQNFKNILNDN